MSGADSARRFRGVCSPDRPKARTWASSRLPRPHQGISAFELRDLLFGMPHPAAAELGTCDEPVLAKCDPEVAV